MLPSVEYNEVVVVVVFLFFNMVTFIYTHQVAYSLTKTYLRKKTIFERVKSHTKTNHK